MKPIQKDLQQYTSPRSSGEGTSSQVFIDSDSPPRKVRFLIDIYESCIVAFFLCELQNFQEARMMHGLKQWM